MYSPASGVTVKATGPGVTYSLSGNIATIVIPSGIFVFSIKINQSYPGIGSNNEMEIWITDLSAPGLNTDKDTFIIPQMSAVNRTTAPFGGPAANMPFPVNNYGTTAGMLEYDIIGIGTPANTVKTRIKGFSNWHTAASGFSIFLDF